MIVVFHDHTDGVLGSLNNLKVMQFLIQSSKHLYLMHNDKNCGVVLQHCLYVWLEMLQNSKIKAMMQYIIGSKSV